MDSGVRRAVPVVENGRRRRERKPGVVAIAARMPKRRTMRRFLVRDSLAEMIQDVEL